MFADKNDMGGKPSQMQQINVETNNNNSWSTCHSTYINPHGRYSVTFFRALYTVLWFIFNGVYWYHFNEALLEEEKTLFF